MAEEDTMDLLPEQWKDLGNEEYKKGHYSEAIDLYTKAIETDEGKTAAFYGNRSAAYLMQNNLSLCQNDCLKAIEIDPSFIKAYMRSAQCYVKEGKLDLAKRQILGLLQVDPKHEQALQEKQNIENLEKDIKKGEAALESGDFDSALKIFADILKVLTHSDNISLSFCESLIGKKRFDQANSVLTGLLRQNSNNDRAIFLRGKALAYTRNPESAEKHYRSALQMDPDNKKYREELKKLIAFGNTKKKANEAFSSGRYQEAYDLYTEGIQMDPKNAQLNAMLYCNRAAALTKLKKYPEAIKDCNASLNLDPDYNKAISRRATVYMFLEEYDKAVEDYSSLTQLEPDNSEYKRLLKDAQLEVKKASRVNHYKILGVERDADENTLKRAYKKLALKWHPDKWASASEEEKKTAETKFKELNEAVSILTDPKKRRAYDRGDDLEEFGTGGMNPNDIFSMFFNQGGMGGGMGGHPFGGGMGGHPFGGGMGGHPFGGGMGGGMGGHPFYQ